MPASVDLRIERSRLRALGTSPSGPIYRHMLRVGTKINTRASANLSGRMVRVRTGVLRAAQNHPPDLRVQGDTLVGTVLNNTRYAAAVHNGTRPHTIRPVNGRVLAWSDPTAAKGVRFAREVHHPGTAARPFLREAAERVIRTDL